MRISRLGSYCFSGRRQSCIYTRIAESQETLTDADGGRDADIAKRDTSRRDCHQPF